MVIDFLKAADTVFDYILNSPSATDKDVEDALTNYPEISVLMVKHLRSLPVISASPFLNALREEKKKYINALKANESKNEFAE